MTLRPRVGGAVLRISDRNANRENRLHFAWNPPVIRTQKLKGTNKGRINKGGTHKRINNGHIVKGSTHKRINESDQEGIEKGFGAADEGGPARGRGVLGVIIN